MTVIDAFLDRPKVVPKQRITFGHRKRKTFGGRSYMPEVEGCLVGGNLLLPPNLKNYRSMEGNGGENAVEAHGNPDIFKEGNEEQNLDGSSPTLRKQKILVKTNRNPVRNRRKSRWKLKFHHQALPPEYLRHYKQQEKKRRQSETGKPTQTKDPSRKLIRKSDKKTISDSGRKRREKEISDVTLVKMEENLRSEDQVREGGGVPIDFSPSSPPSPLSSGPARDSKEPEKNRSPFSPNPNLSACRSSENFFPANLPGLSQLNIDVSQNKAFLENLITNQIEINRVVQKERKTAPNIKTSLPQFNRLKSAKQEERQKANAIPPSGKIMNYSDLPYMGEITLDGIKPRRGRKPKKADICHLIYKNYGQVFPGGPGRESDDTEIGKKNLKWRPEVTTNQLNSSQRTKGLPESVATSDRPDSPLPTVTGLINHSEVQNRIINSLLEKRLTQELRLKTIQPKDGGKPGRIGGDEEPLNLCIRDLKSLKIKLSRKHGNIYETKQKDATTLKNKIKEELDEGSNTDIVSIDKTDSEPETSDENYEEDDLAPFNLVTTELRESSDEETLFNLGDQITLTKVKSSGRKAEAKTPGSRTSGSSSPVFFWPGSGLFLPGIPPPSLSKYSNTPETVNLSAQEKKVHRSTSEGERSHLKRSASNPNAAKPAHVITKRKRSAIFIPPVPAESTTNPTTEVSICKFKFTGGAKPSLQEKKMLSVDSGGNFRYYSGTGDKSMRGYEYFPRESLQQCQENTGCSPSGVFLTASALGTGEKIPEEIGHSGFFDSDFPLQVSAPKTPDEKPKLKFKTKKSEDGKDTADSTGYKTLREHLLSAKGESSDVGTSLDDVDRDDGNSSDQSDRDFDLRAIPQCYFDSFKVQDETSLSASGKIGENSASRNRRLRKTRKSIAREKLEQTFKEKGFLIQTQQLESAEGATYCKFRQLRKFTRYLFRSWKDYLPGNVRNLSVDAGVENPEMMLQLPEVNVRADVHDFDATTDSFK